MRLLIEKSDKELKEATLKASAEAARKQAIELAKFIDGTGVAYNRYRKAALKERLKYLDKNRKQLAKARVQLNKNRAKRRGEKQRAKEAEKLKKVQATKRKRHFTTGEEKRKQDRRWAAYKARYILQRYHQK